MTKSPDKPKLPRKRGSQSASDHKQPATVADLDREGLGVAAKE